VAKFTKDKQPSDGKRKDGRQQRIVPAFPQVGGGLRGFIPFGNVAVWNIFCHLTLRNVFYPRNFLLGMTCEGR